MNTNSLFKSGLWVCFLLILLAAASRLVPHPTNFSPIAALGLFAGAYIGLRRYWLVPLAALLLSDLVIGFYHPVEMSFVYIGFATSAIIGRFLLLQKRNVIRIGATTLVSATVFFLLSNFGVWLTGLHYPLTSEGLLQCYAMAIPFFDNTVLGDLLYVAVLFGVYESIHGWTPHQHRTV